MKPTFENTVDILVKAYLSDTLRSGICSACAVGNIIAHTFGKSNLHQNHWWWDDGSPIAWKRVFMTGPDQFIYEGSYQGLAKEEIDSTGYTWQQLALIENTFETCDFGENSQEGIFNKLMAVVDVLADIHGVDLTTAEQAKALFVKP